MNGRVLAISLIAFLGMVDTFYLSIMRSRGVVECHVTHGCNEVLQSRYSAVAGIPLSLLGLAFYLAVFTCAVFELTGGPHLMRFVFWAALAGFLISLSLTSIQAFVLHAYCEYCLGSAVLVTTIFVLSWKTRDLPTRID
jgi:uncharacterized membrane protein